MKDNKTKPYGYALSAITGIPQEVILKVQAQILCSIVGPKPSMEIQDVPWCFTPSGLLVIGDEIRSRTLLDHLLKPIHEIQNRYSHNAGNLSAIYEQQNIATHLSHHNLGLEHVDRVLKEDEESKSSEVSVLGELSRRRMNASHPLLLLENTDITEIESISESAKARSPLYIDNEGQLLQAPERTAVRLLKSIQGSVRKTVTTKHHNPHTVYSRMGYIGTIGEDGLLDRIGNDKGHTESILRSLTLIRLPDQPVEWETSTDELIYDLSSELTLWRGAVIRALELRDMERTWTPRSIYSQKHYLVNLKRKNLDGHTHIKTHTHGIHLYDNLPTLLLGSTLLVDAGASYCDCPAHVSANANKYLFNNHLATERWIESEQHRSVLERDKARVIRALEKRGACTWQKLCRSFDVQRRDAHENAINALIAEGRLELDDSGMFNLLKQDAA